MLVLQYIWTVVRLWMGFYTRCASIHGPTEYESNALPTEPLGLFAVLLAVCFNRTHVTRNEIAIQNFHRTVSRFVCMQRLLLVAPQLFMAHVSNEDIGCYISKRANFVNAPHLLYRLLFLFAVRHFHLTSSKNMHSNARSTWFRNYTISKCLIGKNTPNWFSARPIYDCSARPRRFVDFRFCKTCQRVFSLHKSIPKLLLLHNLIKLPNLTLLQSIQSIKITFKNWRRPIW